MLDKVQHIVGKESFILLYKSMVRSHLKLSNSVWSPYKIGPIETLEKVQKATKTVLSIKVILPELETEVLVINSFLSILIEKSKRRGHRSESLCLILRYDAIRYDIVAL